MTTQTEALTEVLDAIQEIAKHLGRFDAPMQQNYLVLSLGNQADTLRRLISKQEQEYDWKDLYEKEKRRSAMWSAKYEEVAGPAPKAYPVAQTEQEIEYCTVYHCAGDCGQPHNQKEMQEFLVAQPEQEPVALPCCGYTDASAVKWNTYNQVVQCHNCGHVYTTPPQRTWVGLTEEDRDAITCDMVKGWVLERLAKAIEAKLKEQNT